MEKQYRDQIFDLAREVIQLLPNKLRVRTITHKGNTMMIHQSIYLWVFLIGDLNTTTSIQSLRSRLHNFCKFCSRHDFSDVVKCYSDAADLLISELYAGYDGFKRHLAWDYGDDVGLILSPISSHLGLWFKDEDPCNLSPALTLLRFFKKIPFELEILQSESLEKYLSDEDHLRHYDVDESLELALKQIITDWFKGAKVKNLIPHHGPGNVAEGTKCKYEKYRALRMDSKLLSTFRRNHYFDSSETLKNIPFPAVDFIDRCSILAFVPKTFKALRAISQEPASLQYFQQGVKDWLYNFMSTHPDLAKHVKLRDQSQNQRYAAEGALTGAYATVDLSSASDLVSYRLVKRLFQDTALYPYLLGTRSSQTQLPDGRRVQLLKFAPMGSALCFPIETLIFTAVCELVQKRFLKDSQYSDYSVFGDDMVFPTEYVHVLMDYLTKLGFRVNREKSFFHGNFRESCGKEFYKELDVTPIYYRVSPIDQQGSRAKAHAQLCDLANYSQEKGLSLLRLGVLSLIFEKYPNKFYPLFCDSLDRTPMLWSTQPTNFHLKSRWNVDYQAYEYRYGIISSRATSKYEDDEIDYFDNLINLARRSFNHDLLDKPSSYTEYRLSTHEAVLRSSWKTL